MANQCIGCKREISRKQKNCYICGSSQNYIRHHIKSILLVATLLIGQITYGYWYLGQIVEQTEIKMAELSKVEANKTDSQLEKLRILLQQANDEVERFKSNSTQAKESIAQEKLKFDEVEKKASDAESRARWLNKENRKFQAKIKELSDELSLLKNSIAENVVPTQISQVPKEQAETIEPVNSDDQNK